MLEKRQADLMEDNRITVREIQETLQINSDMSRAMDVILSATNAVMSKASTQGTIECPPCDQVEELCEVFTTKCALKALKEKELVSALQSTSHSNMFHSFVQELQFLTLVITTFLQENLKSIL